MDTTTKTQRDVFMTPAVAEVAAPRPTWSVNCLNCESVLVGTYCAHCGQRAAPPHATLKELSGEALGEFAGWDGKFVTTLKLLFFKPGELTRQFLDGRRAHFISPLRLYLSATVIFFFFVAAARPSAKPLAFAKGIEAAQTQQEKELAAQVDLAPEVMRPLIRRMSVDKKGLTDDIAAELPKALFAMLPVFAAIMMLFYRRRHFAEHLYFSIHLHAFIFATLDVVMILGLLHAPRSIGLALLVLTSLWIPLYTHLAIVRVYGGSQITTFLKELGISVLYAVASVPVIAFLAIWVAWRTA